MAQPDEGGLVKDLFTKLYEAPCEWLRWDDVFPHWVIGYVDETPAGLVCVGFGRPFGWIECLMVDSTLTHHQRGRLTSQLGDTAYALLLGYGAQGALCSVADQQPSFQRIVRRRGFVPVGRGIVYLKRLT